MSKTTGISIVLATLILRREPQDGMCTLLCHLHDGVRTGQRTGRVPFEKSAEARDVGVHLVQVSKFGVRYDVGGHDAATKGEVLSPPGAVDASQVSMRVIFHKSSRNGNDP